MPYGLTDSLIIISFVIFIFGTVVSSRVVSLPTSIFVSFTKVIIPFLYFAFFFDKSWTILDDWGYFENGERLIKQGYGPISSLLEKNGIISLIVLSKGHHFLYSWYNLLAEWLFGVYYYSAVFLNVGLTFLAAFLLYRVALICAFPVSYAQGLFLFFSLHWELLVWSSFVNLKDVLVMLMTISGAYAGICFAQSKKTKYMFSLGGLIFLFFWIRFYTPILMLVAVFLYYLILLLKGAAKAKWFVIASVATVAYLSYMGWNTVLGGVGNLNFGLVNISSGAFKVMLTPRPWALDAAYSYLIMPATLHWMFFIPTIIGLVIMWIEVPQLRPLLLYLLVVLMFYGAFEELQGVRQRFQVSFIYIWAQFHFVWYLLRGVTLKPSPRGGA